MKVLARKFSNPTEFNGPLLVFLLLFLNAKLPVKLLTLAAVFAYNWYMGRKMPEQVKPRAPFFYTAILLTEIIKYLFLTQLFEPNYLMAFSLGCLQWAICIASFVQVRLMTLRYSKEATDAAISSFFVVNTMVSLFFFALLLVHPAWLAYWGHGADIRVGHPSAGDAILGVSLDSSAVNAAINLLGLIYFMHRGQKVMAALCLGVIVLCTSNITLIISLMMLVLFFVTTRLRTHRWLSAAALFFLLGTYLYSSPSNLEYMRVVWIKLTADTEITAPPKEYYKTDSTPIPWPITSKGLVNIDTADFYSRPGKYVSFIQTANYMASSPTHTLIGAGMGNFSSKLAFRVGGAGILGRYNPKYVYRSAAFEANHWATFMHYYLLPAAEHSNMNYPFSTFNQVLGEYGLLGAVLFLLGYIGYFMRRWRYLTYGRYLLAALLLFLVTDYWFEYFSLVIVFETMMLLNLKEEKEKDPAPMPGLPVVV